MANQPIALTSAMRSNLTVLQQMSRSMDVTQSRLSTGKKVNSALDDPVNFFKAKSHQNRASDLAARKDGMKEAIQAIKAADTGIEGIYDLLAQMKSLAQSARTSDVDTTKDVLQKQYDELMQQIVSMANDAAYGGVNLLQDDSSGGALQVDFNEKNGSAGSSLTVKGFNVEATGDDIKIGDLAVKKAAFVSSGSISAGGIADAITGIDDAVNFLRGQAQALATNLSTIQIRADFTDNMINTLNAGADNLTLADMNEEGANMLMLQTRQQLGITALAMSSQAAQAVLQLF